MAALKDVRPLREGVPFGVRIGGLTREDLAREPVRQEINALFEKHGMIVFEGVEASDEMQLALSLVFGPLKEHPVKTISRVDRDTLPGVVKLHAKANSGGLVEFGGKKRAHWLPWHFDHCYNDELNRAGVLRAVKIAKDGGLTGFADGIAMYKLFPRHLLERIEGKEIVYALDSSYETNRFGRPHDFKILRTKAMPAGFDKEAAAMPRAIHPAVWTRRTGEKVLHVSPYMARGIVGEEDEAGYSRFEEICQAINEVAKSCSYHHQWKPNEMLIWDNWRMLHCVSGNNPAEDRIMYRTTIKGDYGLGRFERSEAGGRIPEDTMT